MRNIYIDGQLWKWRVGRQAVVIRGPKGEKILEWCSDLLGLTPDAWEKMKYKRSRYAGITPATIEKRIRMGL